MKKIILFFAFISIFISSKSQIIFEKEISHSNISTISNSVIETDNNNYIICGFLSDTSEICTYIAKISNKGQILNEKTIKNDTFNRMAYDIIELSNNNLLVLEKINPIEKTNFNNYIILTEIDTNLNIISENQTPFPIDTMLVHSINMKKGKNNELVCYGNAFNSNNQTFKTFLYKLNYSADSICFKIIQLDYGEMDLEINKNKIYYNGPSVNNNITKINYADFSTDTVINLFNTIGHAYINMKPFLKFLNDTSFIISGMVHNNNFKSLSGTILDTNFNVLFNKDTLANYGAFLQYNSLDKTFNNEIIIAITSPGSNSLFNIVKTDYKLKKISDINNLTQHIATWLKLIATKDGGAIIIGREYYNVIKTIIIKIDSNGFVTHINGEKFKNYFVVYPNPADKILNIKKAVQVKNANFLLYNSNGKMVLSKNITQNITNLNISNLNTGVYIYNFLQKGKITDKGKIIIK